MYESLIAALRNVSEYDSGYAKLMYDAADAIDELTRENESLAKSVNEASEILRRRWIPVTERLPYESVFVHGKGGELVVAQYSHKHKWWEDDEGYYCDTNYVTHWMPLPELPKEENRRRRKTNEH